MAAGTILSVIANIPWGTVVENAPKVADGASKLWGAVARWNKSTTATDERIAADQRQQPLTESQVLDARFKTLEEGVRHLNEQMRASASLIKDLAEQNTLLVQRIELNRMRLIRLSVAAGCTTTVLLGLVAYLYVIR